MESDLINKIHQDREKKTEKINEWKKKILEFIWILIHYFTFPNTVVIRDISWNNGSLAEKQLWQDNTLKEIHNSCIFDLNSKDLFNFISFSSCNSLTFLVNIWWTLFLFSWQQLREFSAGFSNYWIKQIISYSAVIWGHMNFWFSESLFSIAGNI